MTGTLTTYRCPGDGLWHTLPFPGVLWIEARLDMEIDIDAHGRGKVRAPDDGEERAVQYRFQMSVSV